MSSQISRFRFLATIALTAAVGAQFGPASAATEDAWEAFRADVTAQCLAAAEPLFATAEIIVDPFGSQSYGLALIRGIARGTEDVMIMAICVYDKKERTVEIGGELPPFADVK